MTATTDWSYYPPTPSHRSFKFHILTEHHELWRNWHKFQSLVSSTILSARGIIFILWRRIAKLKETKNSPNWKGTWGPEEQSTSPRALSPHPVSHVHISSPVTNNDSNITALASSLPSTYVISGMMALSPWGRYTWYKTRIRDLVGSN